MNLSGVLARIPYLTPHALEVSGDADKRIHVRMPFRTEVQNHVKTVHAGALFTAAETAAGVAAWQVVPDDKAFVLLRDANVRYTRRAEGDVTAIAQVDEAGATAARTSFEATGRGDVSVRVVMMDPAKEQVFEGTFNYALRPRRQS